MQTAQGLVLVVTVTDINDKAFGSYFQRNFAFICRNLSDSLSNEAIRHGATNRRNPTLTEHAVHLLPYRGLGTGIPRKSPHWWQLCQATTPGKN